MDTDLVTPFVESVRTVFQTMLQLNVEAGASYERREPTPSHDVSGIISLTGDFDGSCVLSFPLDAARRIVTIFAGSDCDPGSGDFADAIGELVNMVTGGAKARFKGRTISISCPTVITGSGHVVRASKEFSCFVIPFTSDLGNFVIEVSVKTTSKVLQSLASATA